MTKVGKNSMALRQVIKGKLLQLLPDYGDRVFIKEDRDSIVSKVSHSLSKDNREDTFVCLTPGGEKELEDLDVKELQYLNYKVGYERYTFSELPVVTNRLRPDVTGNEYAQALGAARKAYHDRIVVPSARSFTPDQIDALKHYRSMFTEDSSTLELFVSLAMDVYREHDVIRKPEQWRENAFKDLVTLGEKILLDILNGVDYEKEPAVAKIKTDAKQAVRDRITNVWQRFFTQEQVFDLNSYTGLFPDVAPSELFKQLYEDVIRDPDVARKPDKRLTDTAKELKDLAKGLSREEVQA